jgi:glutathione S-transferase
MASGIALISRRTIRASVERVFEAWTEPAQLRAWWGPRPVTCSDADVDLRVGGRYRIVNALPDGGTVTIHGEFRVVQPPRKLVYTWCMDGRTAESSLVTVSFEPRGDDTEVVVVHEDIPSEPVRESHEQGWRGCLDGLERHFPGPH